ncbi:MAG: hypothetical protein R3C15_19700 [Thermoleophilia bacterium]
MAGRSKQAANGIRDGQRTCAGTRQDGAECRSFALSDSDYCAAHSGQDMVALGQRGGLASTGNRAIRERLRHDAEENYELVRGALLDGLAAEKTVWGRCPHCDHAVPVTFADLNGRARAAQLILDQSYGAPATTTRIEDERDERLLANDDDLARLDQLQAELARRRKQAAA